MEKTTHEELHDLYCSPNIIRVIKSKRLRQMVHIAHMGRGEVHTRFWWRNLRERDRLEDPSIDRIILKWIFRKWDGGHRVD